MRLHHILNEQRDPAVIAERYRRRLERRIPSDPTIRNIRAACPGYDGALPPDTPELIVSYIHHCVDPTSNRKYVDWIVRRWIEGHRSRDNTIGISKAEDFGRVRQALDIFDRNRQRIPPGLRDINRIHSLAELESVVSGLGETERQRRRRRRRDISVFDDPAHWNWACRRSDHGVVRPRSHAESCAIAAYPRTHWCTAVRDDPHTFEQYKSEGNLFIVVVPGNVESADDIHDLYQLYVGKEGLQAADRNDRVVSIIDLLKRFPCLMKVTSELYNGIDPEVTLLGMIYESEGKLQITSDDIIAIASNTRTSHHITNIFSIILDDKALNDIDADEAIIEAIKNPNFWISIERNGGSETVGEVIGIIYNILSDKIEVEDIIEHAVKAGVPNDASRMVLGLCDDYICAPSIARIYIEREDFDKAADILLAFDGTALEDFLEDEFKFCDPCEEFIEYLIDSGKLTDDQINMINQKREM